MHWANLMELCLVSTSCDDDVSGAWFQQALNDFALNYYDLLDSLAILPSHPRVLINEYYAPISTDVACPSEYHLTSDKASALLSRLQTFNNVLAEGAKGFGFQVIHQNFCRPRAMHPIHMFKGRTIRHRCIRTLPGSLPLHSPISRPWPNPHRRRRAQVCRHPAQVTLSRPLSVPLEASKHITLPTS